MASLRLNAIIGTAMSLILASAANAQPAPDPAPPAREAPAASAPGHDPAAAARESPAAAADQTGLSDIIVTARRVRERLQDVPVSVTAFSGAQLTERNATQISDVGTFTPGLAITPSNSNSTALFLAARGQVQTDTLATLEPSVGVYVDEMYWARAYGLNSSLLDVSNVQALRGPQGTLFGRNTTGGALIITSNDPVLNEFSGSASATYGRFNERTGDIVLNLSSGDRVGLRGALHISRRDGWEYGVRQYDNRAGSPTFGLPFNGFLPAGQGIIRPTGAHFNDRDELQGRVKLLLRASDSTSLVLSGEWYSLDSNGPARQMIYKINANVATDNAATRTAVLAYQDYFTTHPSATGADGFACAYAVTQPATNCTDSILGDSGGVYTSVRTQTYTARFTSELGFGTFKLIGGYRDITNNNLTDVDGSSTILHSTKFDEDLHQYSLEGQLTGSALSNSLHYAVGAIYFTEGGVDRSYAFTGNPSGDRPATATRNFADINNKSWGIYGQASYHITNALTLTAGARYSHDDKGIEIRSANVNLAGIPTAIVPTLPYAPNTLGDPCNAAGAGTITGATPANDCSASRSDSFHAISWTAGLDYKVNDDILLYVKASRGYRSGGQNLRAFNDAQFIPFRPEILVEEEAGIKADLLDRHLRINIAGYHNNLTDAQRNIQQTTGLVSNTIIANAAKVRNIGMEAEIIVRPVRGLTLLASGSFNDSKYLNYSDSLGDRRSDRFIFSPRYRFALSANYATHLTSDVSMVINADYSWTGRSESDRCTVTGVSACYAGAPDQTGRTTTQISQDIFNATRIPAAGLLGARVTFGLDQDRYQLAFWGRNLTNDRSYMSQLYIAAPRRNYVSGIPREPLTYGLTASVRF